VPLLPGENEFLSGESAPRLEIRFVGVPVPTAPCFLGVPEMLELTGDTPFPLGTAAVTGRRGERTLEAALARTRTGEDIADGFETLDLPVNPEAVAFFSLFCSACQIPSTGRNSTRDTYLNSEAYYCLSSVGHLNLFHLLVKFSKIENSHAILRPDVDSRTLR
jgi:hypothetical protein